MTCVFPEIDLSLWRSCLPEDDPEGGQGRLFETAMMALPGLLRPDLPEPRWT